MQLKFSDEKHASHSIKKQILTKLTEMITIINNDINNNHDIVLLIMNRFFQSTQTETQLKCANEFVTPLGTVVRT